MAKMIKKGDLPSKICAGCGLAVAWRKKWARDWNEVKFLFGPLSLGKKHQPLLITREWRRAGRRSLFHQPECQL